MCDHTWRKVFEELLIGGMSLIGWECTLCGKYVGSHELTPSGLGGIVLARSARLYAPCGGVGVTSSGKKYREQIIDEDGTLTIKAD